MKLTHGYTYTTKVLCIKFPQNLLKGSKDILYLNLGP
jgi:hypothetical protein